MSLAILRSHSKAQWNFYWYKNIALITGDCLLSVQNWIWDQNNNMGEPLLPKRC